MNNFIQQGDNLTVVTPSGGYTAGNFYLQGAIAGVAMNTTLEAAENVLVTVGVFSLPKTTGQVWAIGEVLYWDAGTSKFTNVPGILTARGVVAAAALTAATTGYVKLTGGGAVPEVASPISGVADGYKIARGGGAALDGGNPTPIATGLTTIVAAFVQLRGTAAPGDNTSVLTTDFTGSDGTLNVYAWKNTSGSDPTLVASTGTETFDWIAIGT
jgi:predicted RecA/RadA family phage recombinase